MYQPPSGTDVRAQLRLAFTHAHSWPEVRRGGERYLHELAAAMARRGHRVTVYGGATRSSRETVDGVHIVRLPRGAAHAPRAEVRFARAVFPRLLAGWYDVVHSLGPQDAVASIRAARLHTRRRTVFTSLGNPLRAWWDEQRDAPVHDRVVAGIDVYGCLSAFSLDLLRRDYRRDGALTPGGVDLERFRSTAPRADSPTLLFSGAVEEPRKGLDVLLKALALLARDGVDVGLRISGPGDPSRVLAAAPAEAVRRTEVLPLGAPDKLADVYSSAWVTVVPSVHEAFGLVVLESLACGTPVVVSDDAGLPELVTPEVGRLAVPRDAASLAAACREVLAWPTGGARCRAVAESHGWDKVAERIEAVYRKTDKC